MNKIGKRNIQLIITVITIITLSLSATYAYMNFVVSNNTTAQGNAGCFDVNYSGQEINADDIVSTSNYTQGAKYQVTLSKDANCNIYTKVDLFVHTNNATTAPIESIKALKYKVMLSNTEISTGVIDATGDLKIATVNLTTTPTTYDIYIWVDNAISLGFYDQTTYSGYIYAESTQTSTIPGSSSGTKATDYIINKYNDGSAINTVNIGGDTSKPQVHLNPTQGIMLDNNGDYRYYGADPDNYVSYNDELWRIISVGNVKSSTTDTVGETRVKIVKADILKDDNDLSAYSYDSSASSVNSGYGVNDWSKSDLMTELNTLYFNSTSGTCYTGRNNATTACNFTNTGLSQEARNLTGDALYYLGGNSTAKGVYPNDYYTFERGTAVWGSTSGQTCNDGACPRATTWTGRVGIIYPSDYAYATDLSLCTKDPYNYDSDENCHGKDWLLYSDNRQWTISPSSSRANGAFLVNSAGYVNNGGYVGNAGGVRPVQYLKSSVTIVEGEGTSEKPYILGT